MLPLTSILCTISYAYATLKYSDLFARNYMFPLSAAAYSNHPEQCINHLFPNATLRRLVTVQCDGFQSDTCSGYSSVLHNEKAIVLSFRGTTRFMQMLEEIEKCAFASWSAWPFGGRVSKYFHDGFHKLWGAGMEEDYFFLKKAYPEYEIWITGHSLGGSLASLAAPFVVRSKSSSADEIKLVTFGQPRTGDLQFSNAHNSQIKYSFRVTHWRDIVPHVPLEISHYHHHNQETFYKYNMASDSVTVCSGSEDKKCSDGLWFAASLVEHIKYLGKDVLDYGLYDCV